MTQEQIEKMTDDEIATEIKLRGIKYGPHWWYKHGNYIRSVTDGEDWFDIYYIERFKIGDEMVAGDIRYLDPMYVQDEKEMVEARRLRERKVAAHF